MKQKLCALVFFAAAIVLGLAGPAGAVDGTIEINQAKVLANGGSFPYQINASGSYRLTSNLTVSSGTDGIDLNSNHVTIDLNGFSIVGVGSGSGISAVDSVTVEQGTVTGFSLGLNLGNNAIVKSVHADANSNGIQTGINSVVEGCAAIGNGLNGIVVGGGTVISGNTANSNKIGISCSGQGCLVSGNTVLSNSLVPMNFADATSGYGGNVLSGSIVAGTSLGHNLCSGTVC